MRIDKSVIENFQENVRISPGHETEIVHSLQYMGIKEGISEFIQLVSTSESEEDAFFFQNIAKLMLHYIENTLESETSIIVKKTISLF